MNKKTGDIHYHRLVPRQALPNFSKLRPFRAAIIGEYAAPESWQWEICQQLVAAGCRYLLAWGADCQSWCDAIVQANARAWPDGEIPGDALVYWSAFPEQPLSELMHVARTTARHTCDGADLHDMIILHLGQNDREREFVILYYRSDDSEPGDPD